MAGVLIKEEKRQRQTHTEKRLPGEDQHTEETHYVTTEAEVGMIHLPAREHRGLPAMPGARREAWGRFCPRAFRENMALPVPWFWTSGLQNGQK